MMQNFLAFIRGYSRLMCRSTSCPKCRGKTGLGIGPTPEPGWTHPTWGGASDAAPRFESLEKRFDELNRRLEALLKAVEDLRVRHE
jgi:hypothetical protein